MTTYTELDAAIRADLKSLGEHLEQMYREQLWRVKYDSFDAYLSSLHVKPRTGWREIKRFVTVKELGQIGRESNLSKSQIDAIASVTPAHRVVVIQSSLSLTEALGDKLTPGRIKRVADVIEEATVTGSVDIGTGESLPLSAAILQNEVEAIERKAQHIRDKGRRVYHAQGADAFIYEGRIQFPHFAILELEEGLDIKVSVWTEEEEVEYETR